jgi:hypothetical protein
MRMAIAAIAALLLLMTTPAEAPARKLSFGKIFNSVLKRAVPSMRFYGYRRPYAYRSRGRYVRRAAPPAAAAAIAQTRGARMAQAGQMPQPEAFWPTAPRDVFDYVLTAKDAGLWANGYGTVVLSMFAQPAKAGATGETAEQTTGVALNGATVCGEQRGGDAEAAAGELRDALALADDQRALGDLRTALIEADKEITAACPRDMPATVPDRLRTMQDRLWSLRVTLTGLRAPLQTFYDSLSAEQRTKLGAPQPSEQNARKQAAAGAAAQLCYALTQRAPQWPTGEIARAVRPGKEQQHSFGALSETSSKMSQMMMGSCPQKAPATPLARLDTALDWLDALLLATANTAVAVDDAYASLSAEQKTRLDTLSL